MLLLFELLLIKLLILLLFLLIKFWSFFELKFSLIKNFLLLEFCTWFGLEKFLVFEKFPLVIVLVFVFWLKFSKFWLNSEFIVSEKFLPLYWIFEPIKLLLLELIKLFEKFYRILNYYYYYYY